MVDIKLDRVYTIENNNSVSGFILTETRRKNKTKALTIFKTYHPTLQLALKYYIKDVLAKKPEKITTIQQYIDEYTELEEHLKDITGGL